MEYYSVLVARFDLLFRQRMYPFRSKYKALNLGLYHHSMNISLMRLEFKGGIFFFKGVNYVAQTGLIKFDEFFMFIARKGQMRLSLTNYVRKRLVIQTH